MTMTATQAMQRSESHGEIVTLDYDTDAIETLSAECDDSVATNGVTEFWANDPDSTNKMLWRVHVRGYPKQVKAAYPELWK